LKELASISAGGQRAAELGLSAPGVA
jgi:hypothetical protein